MKHSIYILTISILMISCASNQQNKNLKKVTYSSEFQTASVSNPFEKRTFTVMLPKGFSIDKEDFNPEFKEVVYKYNHGSIYITDNNLNGSPLNGDNKIASGITVVQRASLEDSLYIGGKNKGLYWKENILNDIVIGYLNVPEYRKKDFDEAIASIRRK